MAGDEDYEEACSSASEFDDLDIKQAVQFGDISKVKHLIESGLATASDVDADDCSLLHWAAINNRLEVSLLFLKGRYMNFMQY